MCQYEPKFFSTKQAAAYLEISESSIKRWEDSGVIPATKTTGGHRRIESSDLFEFIQTRKKQLHSTKKLKDSKIEDVQKEYYKAMMEGDIAKLSHIVTSQFVKFMHIGNLIDQIIYPSFLELRIECPHPNEICRVLHRAIDQTKNILEFVAPNYKRPLVNQKASVLCLDIGYDVDGLPTYFAEYAIGTQFNVIQIGTNPVKEVIQGAIEQENPKYVWVSANGEKQTGYSSKISLIESLKPDFNFEILKFGSILDKKFNFEDTKAISSFAELANLHSIAL